MVTCSKEKQADLFDAVLGGLGQFGIITRARIPLVPAPARARWVRLLYADAAALTGDQERLIAERGAVAGVMDYVEGSVLTDSQGLIGSWRSQPPSSFFSEGDAARVAALAKEAGGVLYCLEGAVYYGGAADTTAADVDKVTLSSARPGNILFLRAHASHMIATIDGVPARSDLMRFQR
jgi:cytokinin dehydrogenase